MLRTNSYVIFMPLSTVKVEDSPYGMQFGQMPFLP